MRLIEVFKKGKITLRVLYDREWDEYSVKWYDDGEHDEDKTYYTNDKKDALGTAKLSLERIEK